MAAPQYVLPYQSVVLVDTTGQPVNVTSNALNTTSGGGGTSAVNVSQVAGATAVAGNGATTSGTLRVTISNDSTGVISLKTQTSGGSTMYHAVNPNNVTGVVVKNTPGQIYGVTMATSAAAAAYLKLYDASSAPTAGSGTIKKALVCPGSAGSNGSGASYQFPNGIAFATGIAYTFVSLVTDADSTQPTASTFTIDIDYA
jgi:hypothetical protein